MLMMDVFPAVYSTLSPQALIDGVITQYQLGVVHQCVFWNRGLSDIYLVETQKQSYILKISHHHWRSQAEIQFELEFLDFLHARQIPVAYPIKTKDDRLFVTIHAVEGDRYDSPFAQISESFIIIMAKTLQHKVFRRCSGGEARED